MASFGVSIREKFFREKTRSKVSGRPQKNLNLRANFTLPNPPNQPNPMAPPPTLPTVAFTGPQRSWPLDRSKADLW